MSEQGWFESFDGVKLFYRLFPKSCSREWMVLLHGHGEHSGRYEKFADRLGRLPVSLAVYDMRGNGRSGGREVYCNNFSDFLGDLSAFIAYLDARFSGGGPYILFGHSLGALTALHWALDHASRVKGLILSSPCLGLKLPGYLVTLARLLNAWAPGVVIHNPVYPPFLTHDPVEMASYREDPLIKRKISVRLLSEMIRYTALLHESSSFRFDFPVYILAAGREKVVDLRETVVFFDKIEGIGKELKILPDFFHEIFNERGQSEAFACLSDYVEKLLGRRDQEN